jgi:hypothetical protein
VCYRNHDSSICNQRECIRYQHHRCQYLLVYHHTSALFEGKVWPSITPTPLFPHHGITRTLT